MSQHDPTRIPIFPVPDFTPYIGILECMEQSAAYFEKNKLPILPLFLYEPMEDPTEIYQWEPLGKPPQKLVMVSLEPDVDDTITQALLQVEAHGKGKFPSHPPITLDGDILLEAIYRRMDELAITAYQPAWPSRGTTGCTVFMLTGRDTLSDFNLEFRKINGAKRRSAAGNP